VSVTAPASIPSTPRERFIACLERRPITGLVPHFELVFFLTMEAFGRLHPSQRHYGQWDQMSDRERDLHRRDIADLFVTTARTYNHSAIFFHEPSGWGSSGGTSGDDEKMRTLEHIAQQSNRQYFLMMHGDATYSIPDGAGMMKFVEDIADRPQELKDSAAAWVDSSLERAVRYKKHGVLDCYALCADYCFNDNPFLSPAMFDEFITPYMVRLIAGYRELGFYVIKHTDGNIMPILDALVAANPHAIHSLDPQGGVDIAEVKKRVGDKVCLIGNVSCALLDTGTDEQVIESVRYALRHGMPGGGYIFSTSNCIYTGMQLKRYELMLKVWREEGIYR